MHSSIGAITRRKAASLLLGAACLPSAARVRAAPVSGRMLGKYRGQVPESFNRLASYGGVRTGNLKAVGRNTAYIIFDPRCGVCKGVYRESLQYGTKAAIKWIPVNVLRSGAQTEQQAASVLVGGDAARANLKTVMAGGVPQVKVTQKMRVQLRENEALLKAFGLGTAVPLAIFLNRVSQTPSTLLRFNMVDLYGRL